MREPAINPRFLLLFAIVAVAFLIPVNSALAGWLVTHGHGGHVENEAALDSPPLHIGWGLEVRPKVNQTNWVHFAVPSSGDRGIGARNVKVSFSTWGGTSVKAVHVYNGNARVGTFDGYWSGTNTLYLDLGSVKPFSKGLGISVQVQGPTRQVQPSSKIIFYGAGANFVKIASE